MGWLGELRTGEGWECLLYAMLLKTEERKEEEKRARKRGTAASDEERQGMLGAGGVMWENAKVQKMKTERRDDYIGLLLLSVLAVHELNCAELDESTNARGKEEETQRGKTSL